VPPDFHIVAVDVRITSSDPNRRVATLNTVAELGHVDFETFQSDVASSNKPAVIRSLVKDWPIVLQSSESPEATCQYLQQMDNGTAVYTIAAPATASGRFFYSDDLRDVNFKRGQVPLQQVLGQLLAQNSDAAPAHSIAVQALPVRDVLPQFEKDNPVSLIDPAVPPTMWIGNRGFVAPHYDIHMNLACVAAGRRRFVLFPPEQIANLYPGPVLNAPGGVPISLVDPWDPDLDRFPRFAEAMAVAQETLLEPGDALYIPSLWWHGVASLEHVNVLVNYWWGGASESGISPNDSLLHGMLAIAKLGDSQRQAWRSFFDYYVFRSGADPVEHLPNGIDDIVTSLSPEQDRTVREFLSRHLDQST